MAQLFLFGLAGLGLWVGSLYFWPFRPCWKCKGSGRNAGSNRKRFGQCRRCKGSGTKQRLGSKTVHRGAVTLAERRARKKGGK